MENKELVQLLNRQLNSDFTENISVDVLHQKLSEYINEIINTDFNRLVSILYKIDVNENQLKNILREHAGEDSSAIIAKLIIERQIQKLESRKKIN